MRDEDVVFDKKYHVLYSEECKEEISDYLKDYRTDLGGKANFHNGVAGNMIALRCFHITRFAVIKHLWPRLKK